jgi:hypothetical protein
MIEEEIKNTIASLSQHPSQVKAKQLLKAIQLLLDEVSKNELVTKVGINQKSEITNYKQQLSQMDKNLAENYSLLQEKESIDEKFRELKTRQDLLTKIQEKNQALKEFDKVQSDVSTKSQENDSLIKKHIELLSKLNELLANSHNELEKQLSSRSNTAESVFQSILVSLDTNPLKSDFSQLEDEIQNMVANFNYYVTKIRTVREDLEVISKKYDAVISVFKIHQLENEHIFGALQNREGVLEYVKKISEEISQKLNEYDSAIKSLIEKRDDLPMYDLVENKKYQ